MTGGVDGKSKLYAALNQSEYEWLMRRIELAAIAQLQLADVAMNAVDRMQLAKYGQHKYAGEQLVARLRADAATTWSVEPDPVWG